MSNTNPLDTLNTNASELRLDRFEAAWLGRRGDEATPDWRRHLPADDEPCNADLIFSLLELDIECRIKAGLPALLREDYFAHPRLQREDARLDAKQQVELIHWEYQQRLQNGDRPRRAEYEAAFPGHVEALREMKPRLRCPRCRKILVLEETLQTLLCPDCGRVTAMRGVAPFVADAAPSHTPPTELDPRRYELGETLGAGGMGEVYRCCDPALGRDLAIKVMKMDFRGYAEIERRFLREARITASLQHPGIVAVHNLGRLADGRLHYTMRLVRGRTFADILKEEAGKAERWPSLLVIFEKICQAAAYAHSKHVLHRDLKPHNVMVGRFGEVQVMDWGLAKLLTIKEDPAVLGESADEVGTRIHTESADTPSDASRTGSGMGTPAYIPREQALGEWDDVDERADVFALGSILCEILTGNPAYTGNHRYEVERRAKHADLAETWGRLEQCGADAALIALCRECLAGEREHRPRNAAVLAERVAAYQAEVQERLRRAALERVAAEARDKAERRARRRIRTQKRKRLAKANVRQAKQGEADSQAVLEFFQNKVLSAGRLAGPKGGLGKEVTLRQAVAAAEPDIDGSFKDRPLVEASIRNTLGLTYWYLGEAALAIRQHERALAVREAKLGAAHPCTFASRNNLAAAYQSAGRTADAIRLHEQNLKHKEDKLGPDHSHTLTSRHNLANAYRAAGRTAEAIPLLEQTLKHKEAKLGPDHPDTLLTMANLGMNYREAGRPKDAILLLKTALQRGRQRSGELPLLINWVPHALAKTYDRAGRFAKAEVLYRAFLEQARKQFGGDDPRTLAALARLGANLLKQKKYTDAELLLRQCLSIRDNKQPDQWTTFHTHSRLGEALLGQKKYAEAEPLLLQGYEGMKQQQDKIPSQGKVRLTEALERLIRLYEATGEKDKVADWQKKLAEAKAAPKEPKP